MKLATFAYHVKQIATEPAPCRLDLSPLPGVHVIVAIQPGPPSPQSPPGTWDICHVNGKAVGNRSGAVAEFAELTEAAYNAAIAADFEPFKQQLAADEFERKNALECAVRQLELTAQFIRQSTVFASWIDVAGGCEKQAVVCRKALATMADSIPAEPTREEILEAQSMLCKEWMKHLDKEIAAKRESQDREPQPHASNCISRYPCGECTCGEFDAQVKANSKESDNL